jgi:flavodoxin/ferredoxin
MEGSQCIENEEIKTLIISFSQTGNTEKIGRRIQEGVINTTGQCDFIPLNEIDISSLKTYDLIGIGSPVFFYKEPFNVRDFITFLPDLNGQNWFVFCTHGNVIGNFFPSVASRLKNKNANVIGYFHSYAGITVPYYPEFSYTSGHPDSHDLEQATIFGHTIADLSPKIKDGTSPLIPTPEPVSSEEWIKESQILSEDYLKQVTPKFTYSPDTCIKCYKCRDNCPVDGIDIEKTPVLLQDPCIFCYRCITICPTLSINANWKTYIERAPSNYKRYKRELDRATEKGEFRWLVDPDIVDVSDSLIEQRERELKRKKE